MAERDELVRLLHHVDGHLGLAVYRGDGAEQEWKDEARDLIVRLRRAISFFETGEDPAAEHLGKQVKVTLAIHDEDGEGDGAPVVAEGVMLGFGDYGEVILRSEDGALQRCWPMLQVEPVDG